MFQLKNLYLILFSYKLIFKIIFINYTIKLPIFYKHTQKIINNFIHFSIYVFPGSQNKRFFPPLTISIEVGENLTQVDGFK